MKIKSASFTLPHPILCICINAARFLDPHGSALKHLYLTKCTGYPELAFSLTPRLFLLPVVGYASLLRSNTYHYCIRLPHTW